MISELLSVIESGARKNKYRVTVSTLNGIDNDINTLCHAASLPGRNLTPTEVTVKGRKAQLRGETSYDGTWEMTIYNTENMEARDYFINWMVEVHNTNMNPDGFLGNFSVNGVSLNQVASAVNSISNRVNNFVSNPFGFGIAAPYQRDIKIEQLDNKGKETYEMYLRGAFPTSVGAVDYDDQAGEISTTTITFAYTDIEVGSASDIMLRNIVGDSASTLF